MKGKKTRQLRSYKFVFKHTLTLLVSTTGSWWLRIRKRSLWFNIYIFLLSFSGLDLFLKREPFVPVNGHWWDRLDSCHWGWIFQQWTALERRPLQWCFILYGCHSAAQLPLWGNSCHPLFPFVDSGFEEHHLFSTVICTFSITHTVEIWNRILDLDPIGCDSMPFCIIIRQFMQEHGRPFLSTYLSKCSSSLVRAFRTLI